MAFIMFLTLTSYTTIEIPKTVAQTAGRSGWIMILTMAMIYSVVAVIITKLNNMFQGKVLFDYSKEIIGKFFTYLVALFYFFVALMIAVYLKVKLVNLLTANFLSETPPIVLLLAGILLFGYVAYKGITNIARMYEIIGVLYLITTIVICTFMLFQGMGVNILPLFRKSDMVEFFPTVKNLVIPFTGMGFLLVIPFTAKNKKAPKVAFLTVMVIGVFYVMIVECTMMTLGLINTASFNDAFIEAIKMVKFPVIERTDILYLTVGLTGLFAGTITIYTSAVEFACRIFPKLKRHVVVIGIAVILIPSCLIALKQKNFSELYTNNAPYVLIATSFLIPFMLLIIAKMKQRIGGTPAP